MFDCHGKFTVHESSSFSMFHYNLLYISEECAFFQGTVSDYIA